MEVQVVIKAPNQNVEDYVVHCNLEWTVQQLKENLSKAYPSKPKVNEQKLIYSGRLLLNNLRLKDILRHEDGNSSVHILHLVCSSDSTFGQASQTWGLPTVRPMPLATGQSTSNTVRQRNVTSVPPTNTNFPPNLAPPPSMPVFIPDSQVVAQYAAMQQMYAYYFSQYIQSMNPAIVPAFNPAFPGIANYQYQPPTIEVPAQTEPPQENLPPEVDEFLNRDWLDHAFQCARFVILFMLLFYYSTPERLGIVMLGALIALLYQEGWFMRRAAPPAEIHPTQEVHNPADPPDLMEEPNTEMEDNEDPIFGEYELAATMDGDEPPHAQQTDAENNNHIFSPLTFLSTFFSSLIPDPPPAPLNIN